MTDRSTVQGFVRSFVVRVYRFDPAERRHVAGVIEAVDGSGTSTPFANTAELGEVLRALLAEENRVDREPGIGRREP